MNTTNFMTWLDAMQLTHPLVIAGPCSAETEEQVLETAHQLKNSDATVYRAGIWKPRTRPGSFEGNGEKALPWLQRVKEETGLLTTVEVGNSHHVKLALQYDVDILWIGARTTVNPFLVQEIADALQGTEKIVLVKNPINPDLGLWIGALERFYKADIKNLGAIHRGFSSFRKTKYRNKPKWQIAIDLKNQFPKMPIICDPSHISGRRDLIFDVSQTALDLNYNGLMIETHCNPDAAWSDAKQQITPTRLNEITKQLKIRNVKFVEEKYKNKLENLREEINVLDKQLIDLLSDRMHVAEKIGLVKKERNVAILQNVRWQEIMGNMIANGEEVGLTKEFIENLFKAIHTESIQHQKKIVNN